jgi:hypothetical protein
MSRGGNKNIENIYKMDDGRYVGKIPIIQTIYWKTEDLAGDEWETSGE